MHNAHCPLHILPVKKCVGFSLVYSVPDVYQLKPENSSFNQDLITGPIFCGFESLASNMALDYFLGKTQCLKTKPFFKANGMLHTAQEGVFLSVLL